MGGSSSGGAVYEIVRCDTSDLDEVFGVMEAVSRGYSDNSVFCADSRDFIARHIRSGEDGVGEGFVLKAVKGSEVAGFLIVRFP
ncbi:MAG: hypothetical protein IJ856_07120, partial [Candidatus Methanomethylophilaceae archaeon]|nr:hypothetical protein [Candidatus Methanomethylophilaceae archaeon]